MLASSSATPTGGRSPTSILRRSRGGGQLLLPSEWVSVHRFQVEYPLEVPSAQLIWVTPTNVPSPLMPSYFPVPPV